MIKHVKLDMLRVCGHGDNAFVVKVLKIEWTDGNHDVYAESSSGEYKRAYGSEKSSKLGNTLHIGDVIALLSNVPILQDISTRQEDFSDESVSTSRDS